MRSLVLPSTVDPSAPPAPGGQVVFGFSMMGGAVLLAAWVVAGRFLFGIGGELALVYALTIGVAIVALQAFAGRAVVRTARRARRTTPSTIAAVSIAWGCGILLGLTIPDVTASGPQSIVARAGDQVGIDMAIAVSNPLGILTVAASVAALTFASGDARGRVAAAEED